MNYRKYHPYPDFSFPERAWPSKKLTRAPIWCSVDLRDGNQSLETPMTLEQKIDFFRFLVETGFREIEIGFPAASETEYNFARTLIENGLIPDGVCVQVLTQARDHIMERTFEALEGVKSAIVHLYNSTSELQRRVVFRKSKDEIRELAVHGAERVMELAGRFGPERFRFEYSPESFTGTEPDYALEVCNAVLDVWKPAPGRKAIINLPSTVEMSTPNVYADIIEYMCNGLKYRDSVLVSIHAHNDRGTAVAASELALLAGADRIEGTLFGNGERTGNADILTVAMNLCSQGVDPELDFSDMNKVVDIYEKETQMTVPPRHPYAGKLVFTAFSGSHQDAINKGLACRGANADFWEVPYLPIDPADVGRSYEAIIRINSQSGKGGVSYILESGYGIVLPKAMRQDFGDYVTKVSDERSKELGREEIYRLFMDRYVNIETPVRLVRYDEKSNGMTRVDAVVEVNGLEQTIYGEGNGIIDAFATALKKDFGLEFEITSYSEHSLDYGSQSRAITYIHVTDKDGKACFGSGISSSISKSSLRALISAANRMTGENDTTNA
ncbi:MAG: 2-isopropylmalate synthase [Firmicutes bacterium]|nr:2-isopropylmalate synthase [Bacillota bacterium]